VPNQQTDFYKELIIKGKYEEFKDFYDVNKELIYKSIIDVFRGFKKNKKRVLKLYISAKIKDLEWDTEFKFNRKETIILKRDLMPYFEQIEDYETCSEIISLYNDLTN
jgi:hypothetical protein